MDKKLLQIPTGDVSWLSAALEDALHGGAAVMPLAVDSRSTHEGQVAPVGADSLQADTALVLPTSGSTGIPKMVELSAEALLTNARAAHDALAGSGQWLVALPLHTIAGLGQVVRSIAAQTKPVFAMGADPLQLMRAAQRLEHGVRYTSLVPTQLQKILDAAQSEPELLETLLSFSAILVGGAPVSLQLRQRCYELGVNIVRTYGSTETAGGCVYDGVAIGDARVRVRGGEIQLSGSNLASGYLADSALTAQRFITEQTSSGETVRWYRTGDSGSMLGGMLEVTGRIDRVFISGGINVSLARIEDASQRVAGVQQCCAVAVADAVWGQRAVLYIVRGGGRSGKHVGDPAECRELEIMLAAQLKKTLKEQIGPAAVPVKIFELPELPLLGSGKIDVLKLQEHAA